MATLLLSPLSPSRSLSLSLSPIPFNPAILSIQFEDKARCWQLFNMLRVASILTIGGSCPYSRTFVDSVALSPVFVSKFLIASLIDVYWERKKTDCEVQSTRVRDGEARDCCAHHFLPINGARALFYFLSFFLSPHHPLFLFFLVFSRAVSAASRILTLLLLLS